MYHSEQTNINKIIDSGMNVLLEGESGTGKSTVLLNAAKEKGVKFLFTTGTKQATVNSILGFISINGTYIRSNFRDAYEYGHYFSLEEINGFDPNVLLIFNSLENGIMPFPDGYDKPPHKNFRLMATMNPDDNVYTGRTKLDHATIDRFYRIHLDRDPNLELSLTDEHTVKQIEIARKIYKDNGVTKGISMRDAIRLHKLTELGLDEYPIDKLLFKEESTEDLWTTMLDKIQVAEVEEKKASKTQQEAETIEEWWEIIQRDGKKGTDRIPEPEPKKEYTPLEYMYIQGIKDYTQTGTHELPDAVINRIADPNSPFDDRYTVVRDNKLIFKITKKELDNV